MPETRELTSSTIAVWSARLELKGTDLILNNGLQGLSVEHGPRPRSGLFLKLIFVFCFSFFPFQLGSSWVSCSLSHASSEGSWGFMYNLIVLLVEFLKAKQNVFRYQVRKMLIQDTRVGSPLIALLNIRQSSIDPHFKCRNYLPYLGCNPP